MTPQLRRVITRLEAAPKKGASYEGSDGGKGGWRNPIRNDTGLVLYNLVKARQATNIIEVGTAYGLSACYLAAALPRHGLLHTVEFDPETSQAAQANLDEALKDVGVEAHVFNGDGITIIEGLGKSDAKIQYEVVFLDANKDGYIKAVQALQRLNLLTPNCLVIADNVLDRATEVKDFIAYMQQYNEVTLPVGHAEGMDCAGLSIAIIP